MPVTPLSSAAARGVHYDFLKPHIPVWFLQSSTQRQLELSSHALQLPTWYARATPAERKALGLGHDQFRESLNTVEAHLGAIQDILEFAEPRLKAAIQQQFGLALDVKNVYLARKFGPPGKGDISRFLDVDQPPGAPNYSYRGVTLLEAALANFDAEAETPLPCADCRIITTWSSYDDEIIPSFEVLSEHAVKMTPHAFARLCRTLDLGAQYQTHIKAQVAPDEALKRQAFEQSVEQHHREQLRLSMQVADLHKLISTTAHAALQQLVSDTPGASLDGRPLTVCALKVFDSVLVGPLLIGPARRGSSRAERLVVYLPDDPQQPLKEYADSGEFMADLRMRLHSVSYRRYFSRFIPVREQGVFFRRFNTLYQPADGVDANLDYPLQSRLPRLPLDEQAISVNLWTQLRQARLRKVFADARAVAVPTGDEDSAARVARLTSYVDAVVSVFNLAAFALPELGPLMLVVGAAQLCDDAFEGIEAYEVGETREMWAHLASVGMNLAAAGTGAKVLPQVRLSSLVDGLEPVVLPNGERKLWRRDLQGYAAPTTLPVDARPNELGLYTHEGYSVLPLEGVHYRVGQDPASGEYRIRHPSRMGAYEPRLLHNGQGAWHHELESPRSWHGPRLMRRLGPVVDGFSDSVLEQVRQVSGVDEDVLRRVHAESEPVPAILLDTLRQFRAYASAVEVAQGIGAGALPGNLCGYAAILAVELPGWPAARAIEAVTGSALSGSSVKYGNLAALPADTLSISRAQLMAGKLPERIVDFLSEDELERLTGRYTERGRLARIEAVRTRLQTRAIQVRARLMRSLYTDQQPMTDAAEMLVQRDFKNLPALMVREMLAELSPAQRTKLGTASRLPLDLAQKARALQQQMRLAQAYEGLYLDALANRDTEALVLNTLDNLPGWTDNLRLEVRDGGLDGALRASFGPVDASERKVLVRVGDGLYEARNARDEHLHGRDDLYASLQHALPDRHRLALGVPHVAQGPQLKQTIIANALPREPLRAVLNMQTPTRSFFHTPVRVAGKLGYPLTGRGVGTSPVTIESRVRELFPAMSDAALVDYLQGKDLENTAWLFALEVDYKRLGDVLTEWRWANRDYASLRTRRRISSAIKAAWRNSSPYWDYDVRGAYRGQCIELSGEEFGPELATLPVLPGNFNHVTSIRLIDCALTEAGTEFLSTFRKLRALDLSNNALTRLPPVVDELPFLEHLALEDNEIVLTTESVASLRTKRAMEMLSLDGNPLGMVLDISRMGRLKFLMLASCELSQWPTGLFVTPRSREFVLDLSYNPLSQIPDVAPGSERAETLARTAVSHDQVSPEVSAKLKLYMESIGLDPERAFPPRRLQGSGHWMAGLTPEQWLEKLPVWNAVEEAEGAEPFFNELQKLSTSSDTLEPNYKEQLTAKVWRMLEAMAADTDLREHLFLMALAPTTCVDAGAQLFNAMGVEVLVQEARGILDEPLRTQTLLGLAIGKSRLDELGKIAKARMRELKDAGMPYPIYDEQSLIITQYDAAGEPLATIDEVEIDLAYHTGLATALDLPWQSRTMMFVEPNVTPVQLENAYRHIEALEQGDLLSAQVAQQPFWESYIRDAYAERFRDAERRIGALTDLIVAQEEWQAGSVLSAPHRQALRDTILSAGQVLGKTSEQLAQGQVMSQEQYTAELATLSEVYSQLLVTLTGTIIRRFPSRALAPWAPGLLP